MVKSEQIRSPYDVKQIDKYVLFTKKAPGKVTNKNDKPSLEKGTWQGHKQKRQTVYCQQNTSENNVGQKLTRNIVTKNHIVVHSALPLPPSEKYIFKSCERNRASNDRPIERAIERLIKRSSDRQPNDQAIKRPIDRAIGRSLSVIPQHVL